MGRRQVAAGLASLLLTGRAAQARPWDEAAISVTYDDGLPSHLDIAAPALERLGLRGTFYLTWDNMADRAEEWAAIARRGHELAAHTMHHPCNIGHLRAADFARREFTPLERWLDRVAGADRPRDFAYPCDVTNLGPGKPNAQARRYARMLRSLGIETARTSEGPPNPRDWVERNPFHLQALAIGYDAARLSDVVNYIEHARAERRWAILVLHDIGEGTPQDGVLSISAHVELLQTVARSGLAVRTVGEQMRRLRPR